MAFAISFAEFPIKTNKQLEIAFGLIPASCKTSRMSSISSGVLLYKTFNDSAMLCVSMPNLSKMSRVSPICSAFPFLSTIMCSSISAVKMLCSAKIWKFASISFAVFSPAICKNSTILSGLTSALFKTLRISFVASTLRIVRFFKQLPISVSSSPLSSMARNKLSHSFPSNCARFAKHSAYFSSAIE